MIENPKSLTEQLLNLAERIAIEMRVLLNTINTKLDKNKWNELKALAFKDSVSFTENINKLDYDPVAEFNTTYKEPEKE